MAENAGSDESEFDSVTSSQRSLLKHCPFADPVSRPTKSSGKTNSDSTEIIGNKISPTVVKTPILSFSSPTSLDSINDDDVVFRTPPENASLSSAADSETRVRVSKLKSPSSKTETTPVPPSLPPENVRVSQTSPLSDPVTGVLKPLTEEVVVKSLSPPPSVAAKDGRAPGKCTASYSPSPTSIGRTGVSENQPVSDPVGDTEVPKSSYPARVSGKPLNLGDSSSDARVSGKPLNLGDSSSDARVSGKPLNLSDSSSEGEIPFQEIIEALLRNSGENRSERTERVSYVDILKQCGLKFPK